MTLSHPCRLVLVACFALGMAARAAESPAESADALRREIEQLKTEVERLKSENAELRKKLEGETAKPARPPADEIKIELGDEKTLGAFKYRAPAGWVAQSVKGSNLGITYVSPDKAHAVLLQVRAKGAAPPEMQPKFATEVVGLQKSQLAKSKAAVVEPPTVQPDTRFYCRFQEKLKVNPDKTAQQLHLYRNVGKDMVEVTAITTSEDSPTANRVIKLAEDLALGVKSDK
ncbi:MAG TPA: hypothetical protein VEA69_00715 [Tepidisphaeraceae bacterium]|nr:hypothetical protein [Tepidisphaeraceae bacterium]